MPNKCDVLIIGAGVVGLSTGMALLQSRPSLKIIIADKEKNIALHASGRNSGVIHAGFYYSPDSLKAKFCRDGNFELRKLAKKYGIPVKDVGKVVVARNADEDIRLNTLFERGIANGVELEIHPEEKLKDFEPLAITTLSIYVARLYKNSLNRPNFFVDWKDSSVNERVFKSDFDLSRIQ